MFNPRKVLLRETCPSGVLQSEDTAQEDIKIKYAFSQFFGIGYAFQAIVIAYIPLYCRSLGFSPFHIAAITSAESLACLSGPPIIVPLVSRWGQQAKAIVFTCVLAFFIYLPLLLFNGFWAVIVTWYFCLFVNRSMLSIVNATAMRIAGYGAFNFGRARLWGSLGFIFVTYVVGYWIDVAGEGVIIPSGAINLGLIVLASLFLYRSINSPVDSDSSNHKLAQYRKEGTKDFLRVLWSAAPFLLIMTLIWASHAALYTFFSIHLKDLGWSNSWISLAWILSVLAEIVVFIYYDHLERWISVEGLLKISVLLTAVRWFILGTSDSASIIMLSQLLHAFSFGGIYISSMKLVHHYFPEHSRDMGQALLMVAGSGFGTLIGRLIMGAFAERLPADEGLYALFQASAVLAAIAYVISLSGPIQRIVNYTNSGQEFPNLTP